MQLTAVPNLDGPMIPRRHAMLEVIEKGSCTATHPTPLLFVHGAWHAAWCWDEHFLDFFANTGFRAVAVSLRGHGASTSSTRSSAASFADHVDDVQCAVDMLGSQPILVGHSLGGLVVQKYLENHDAPAAVLMAPHPRSEPAEQSWPSVLSVSTRG
jgi:pimeloyl-ACP methyl ester carboxylesterase